MANGTKNEAQKKKTSPLPIIFIALVALFKIAGSEKENLIIGVVAVVMLLLPFVVFFMVVRSIKKRSAVKAHSHDRIDHREDLKINPKTGKTENRPVRRAAPHSAEEHWKQQLDGLLANGTIDRAEYRALLKRKY